MENIGIIGYTLGLYSDNGKENGSYWHYRLHIGGLYWDNGKENGNYWDYRVYIGILGCILWVTSG